MWIRVYNLSSFSVEDMRELRFLLRSVPMGSETTCCSEEEKKDWKKHRFYFSRLLCGVKDLWAPSFHAALSVIATFLWCFYFHFYVLSPTWIHQIPLLISSQQPSYQDAFNGAAENRKKCLAGCLAVVTFGLRIKTGQQPVGRSSKVFSF